ncbi:MAG TPA: IS1595 family transposase [Xanthobacteraceae bacterium]|nr:IS1595 family transposase [Xanthobacteraceae bacterium]
MSVIAKRPFSDEEAAFEYLERTLWPDGPVCPHCGTIGRATKLGGRKGDGKRQARLGLWKCNERECRKQFTVKVGTVFEHGRIPLHKMLQAVYLLCCSKKGCSSHQLHRILQITYKSAWFLSHRIREAMRSGHLTPLGGLGKIVEADETTSGWQEGQPKQLKQGGGWQNRNVVLTLVERGGEARSFHVDGTTLGTLLPIIRHNIDRETTVMTDAASWYKNLKWHAGFAAHHSVHHESEEYVRYAPGADIHTNTVEGYYSIFKRGMKGIYQHCGEKHLHRYLAEFDFRYSNRVALGIDDVERYDRALRGMVGKRLTYRAADC